MAHNGVSSTVGFFLVAITRLAHHQMRLYLHGQPWLHIDPAEIVAGCLQDATTLNKCKAIIVGEQTFGKGSVQSILPLADGSALRLTTAKYYTPSHKVIHEKGITPDIMVPMSEEEERDAFLKRTPGGIEAQPEKDQERIRNARDPQLERAMDLLKGISLYTKRSTSSEKDKRTPTKAEKIASKQTSKVE